MVDTNILKVSNIDVASQKITTLICYLHIIGAEVTQKNIKETGVVSFPNRLNLFSYRHVEFW